jgi:lipoprotein-anchoring transpeptidase ErfK/SrfK
MLCVRPAAKGRLCCAAVVAASIAVGVVSQASAATYYWNDSEPGIISPDRSAPPRRQKARHNQDKAAKSAEKETAKPQGPLLLAVSLNKQQVKVYDANGLFTTASVSTGMKGHATPLGVFSVIQKQKFHRSNIYSGAPMPFMQRITWSGIALHAGVLPGYPASHGCIRMPPGFAVKMYGLTRMGARVVITPGEVAPASFTHPLLAAFKAPEPTASVQPEPTTPAAAKTDKGAALDLRSTIGHDGAKPAADTSSASLRDQTHTADAGNATGASVTASDAPSGTAAAHADAAAPSESKIADDMAAVPTKPGTPAEAAGDSKPADAPAAESETKPADAAAKTDITKTETAPVETKADESKPADTADKPVDAKDQNKNQTRMSDIDKPLAPAKPELKHNSQVAIFISRKDGKLYVRQSLAPVFSVPVTIAPSDRPLGTHVFTAVVDKTDANVMHWSVISMPSRSAAHTDDGEKVSRHGKKGAEVEAKVAPVPDSAAEALDRITIPADVTAWLGEALSTGSSLIVSDQGINQGETGEGTEFILSLR